MKKKKKGLNDQVFPVMAVLLSAIAAQGADPEWEDLSINSINDDVRDILAALEKAAGKRGFSVRQIRNKE